MGVRELKDTEPVIKDDGQQIRDLGFSEVMSSAGETFPESALQLGKDTIAPFLSPIETAKNAYELGSSIVNLVRPGDQGNEQIASSVGKYFANRYGGFKEIKNTIATDPAGFLADAASVLSLGGGLAVRAPGITGKMARVSGKIGNAIDPLAAAAKVAGKAMPYAGKAVSSLIGDVSTRAGAESINQAASAGATGGRRAEAFLSGMRQTAPIEDIVKEAQDALLNLKKQKNRAYVKNMQSVNDSVESVSLTEIEKALGDSVREFTGSTGRDISGANVKLKEMSDIVGEYKNIFGDSMPVIAADEMKQEIFNSVINKIPMDDKSSKMASMNVYGKITSSIEKAAPEYAKAMSEYKTAASEISDIEKTMSIPSGKRGNIDSSVRKLQSIFRNNANTNYGRRAELGDKLEGAGADTLLPALAGQQLSSVAPRGIAGSMMPMANISAAAYTQNPLPLMTLPFQSPRLMGEAAYYGGKGTKAAGDVAKSIGPAKGRALGLSGFQSGRVTDEDRFPAYGLLNRNK